TAEFLGALDFIVIAVPSILLKGLIWCLGFIYLAKGAKKIFIVTEFIGNITFISANILGYYYYGIRGLGISMLLSSSIFLITHYLIVRHFYKFSFSLRLALIFWLQLIFCITGMILSLLFDYRSFVLYISPIIIGNIVYSVYQINKRIGLFNYFIR
ncbi:MAG: hypothetical protein JXB49_04665, partial [Bacteroidales bacterium]|nr:hypothetical protein [Bacteroidales bacterium]